uniref:PuwA n=2 Tax=Cylindrospermum TaxID=56106 RepID=A0A346GB30_9NOST|nr:PuwA [Cylindrospermum moravicum CCALA 993]AXN93584.1 PuwA [Cylindrospermum alatosporum CCALA 994]
MSDLLKRLDHLSPEKRELVLKKLQMQKLSSATENKIQTLPIAPIPRDQVIPLSFAQQRLWFLDQLVGPSATYNTPSALQMTGDLNVTALEQALAEIVHRHEALRTSFQEINNTPVQVIAPRVTLALPVVDLQGLPNQEQSSEVKRLVMLEADKPFDLYQPPLLRGTLLRLSENSHVLLLTVHHIVFDGWSMGVFIQELSVLYPAFAKGEPSPLPDLTVQYADFAVWQRQWLSGEVLETKLNYWRQKLAGAPPLLELPTDRPRPPVETFRGGLYPFQLNAHLTQQLNSLSQKSGVTLFMTLQAAFVTLLHRYSGQDDILIGTPIANRNRQEIEPLIGFFVNTLVLRTKLQGNPKFSDLLKQVQQVALESYEYQDVPFEQVVEALQPERNLDHNPLFQVMFVLQNAPTGTLKLLDLALTPLEMQTETAKRDLTLSLIENGEGLEGSWEYNRDLFDESTIMQMAGHFQTLLAEIVANPTQRIAHLPMLSESEQQRLLVEWNDTQADYPTHLCLHQWFEQQVQRTPEAVAVVWEDQRLTYSELNHRANQLAHYLQTLGVDADVLVGICVERSLEMVVGLLGILKAGGAYVPLDPAYPRDRLRYMLNDSQVPLLLTQSHLLDILPEEVNRILCLDSDWQAIAHQSCENVVSQVQPQNLAYIIYTSGSTGEPKGTMIRHQGVVNYLSWCTQAYAVADGCGAPVQSSFAFDATITSIFSPLMVGGQVVLLPEKQEIEALCDVLRSRRRFSLVKLTPAHLELLNQLLLPEELPESTQALVIGGEALLGKTLQFWQQYAPNIRLINEYGPTETVVGCCIYEVTPETSLTEGILIGRPIANTQLYILDQFLQPVPIGVRGELYIGGAGVARGYLNRPELTAERFIKNPFSDDSEARLYKTGDLARYRLDGNIEYLGRMDNQVKLRGFRIELGEIEAAIAKYPEVRETVVIIREDIPSDKRLVAYVVPNSQDGEDSEPAEDTEFQSEQLSQWQQVFNDSYSQSVNDSDPTFNIIGWNDSRTGLLIPKTEMRQWVEATVERILYWQPHRVLEIGCGTGLLLFRIAQQCQHYYGTDISHHALQYVEQQMSKLGGDWSQVQLAQGSADQFQEFETASFDAVILNSVVQYFPSIDYLLRVVATAVAANTPGGFIFIGDVRNLPLLEAFHTSVQFHQAPSSLSAAELRQRVQRSLNQEPELVIDPAFFTALQHKFPQITHVQIQIKRGDYHNELTQFRYDVTLHLGDKVTPLVVPQWLDWQQDDLTLTSLGQLLTTTKPEILGIKQIPNARLQKEERLLDLLFNTQESTTVGELNAVLPKVTPTTGVDPEALWAWENELPYKVHINWSVTGNGDYDVVFVRCASESASQSILPVFDQAKSVRPWSTYANNLLQGKLARTLVPQLRNFLKEKLPGYMIPNAFMLLPVLPLTTNGKVDRVALPAPNLELSRTVSFVPPRTPAEEIIAEIIAEVLVLESVGIYDNFFELGGHSLLATQVISRLQAAFQVELPLRCLFEAPTVTELDEFINNHRQTASGLTTPAIAPAPRTTPHLPMSWAQQRLWFLSQLEGASATYNMPNAVEITGDLQVDALKQALVEIVRRHEILRTSFHLVEGGPVQVINPTATLTLPVVDLRKLPVEEHSLAVEQLSALEAQEPFELEQAPLVRATLIQLGEKSHVLLFILHHIVCDGWSMGILIQELSVLYPAFAANKPSPLPELPIQYADFAVWQRQWLSGDVLDTKLNYWKQQLADASPVLELPTDKPRPAVQTFRGDRCNFAIKQDLSQQINRLSQQTGTTLFMTLQAAFVTLLHRYSGQDDILIGTPIANRNRQEIEPLIGFFVNTLVLRTKVDNNPKFTEVLTQVRQVALDAYSHQDVPFEQVVEALQPDRKLSHSPLFQVMFAMQNAPMGNLELPGLNFTPLEIENVTAKFDLTLAIWETKEGLTGWWEYNSDLFEAETICRMIGHFETLLRAIATNPEQRLAQLPMLTEEEQQLFGEWNSTQTEYTTESIPQLFTAQVQRTPDAVAVLFGQEQLTYRELDARANQLAHYLQTLGVGPEVVVGICLERSLDLVVGLLGILKAGGAYVPLDPAYPRDRLGYMLKDSQAAVLLTQSHLIDILPEHESRLVCLDTEWQSSLTQLYPEPANSRLQPDNLAYVIYTSGSTGTPKGVAMTQGALTNLLLWQIRQTRTAASAKTLQFAPVSFDVSFQEMFTTWCTGGTLVLLPDALRKDATALLNLLSEQSVERVFLPFVALQQLAEAAAGVESLPPLREIMTAGEQLQITPALKNFLRRLPGCSLHNQYGPSETHVVTAFSLEDGLEELPALPPIGRPIDNTQIYILDRQMQQVPIGVRGELYIGGVGVARGYLNRPDLTEERFIPDFFTNSKVNRLYKTGDGARYLPDGNIEYLGRMDDQVKVRGFRIELGEIEAVLGLHPQVQQAIAIAYGETAAEKRLVVYVVLSPDQPATPEQLRKFLQQRLPEYMIPSVFIPLETVPLTPSGKVDRRSLPAPFNINQPPTAIAPRDPLELQLAQIWSEVLAVDWVGIRDNFFEIGGHSLLAIRLMAQIQQQFGKQLPLATLFQSPTIEELANLLRQSTDTTIWSSLVPIQPVGTNTPFFCVPGAGGNVIYFYELARCLGADQPFYSLQPQGLDGESAPMTQIEDIAAHYITAIQTVQPQGPYLLGGHSFGGLVAFEMAQQLQQQGHEIALLAILDTTAPVLPDQSVKVELDDTTWLVQIGTAIERLFGKSLNISPEILQPLTAEAQLDYLLEQLKIANILPADAGKTQFRGFIQVYKTHTQAFSDYYPQSVHKSPITLLRASEISDEEAAIEGYIERLQEPTLGWSKFSTEPVEIHMIPGTHLTMMVKPNVQVLAEQLGTSIRHATSDS